MTHHDTSHITFETFEKDILPNKIVDSLLTLIKEKQLLPGDKLPPERELARMMNVGRPSLREALRALSVMNVIEVHPGAGAYVSALQPEQLVEHLDFVFALDNSSIFHLFDTRKTLEIRTVTVAAELITPQEIAKLESCVAQMAVSIKDPVRLDEIDREFHKTIAAATKNPILFQFVSVVNQLGKKSRCISYNLPEALRQTFDEHMAIIEALKAHDVYAAQQAMLYHLERAELHLRQLLPDNKPDQTTPA
jgi:GntR family transcriptional repressor for pyruvate dehydrogenase complex